MKKEVRNMRVMGALDLFRLSPALSGGPEPEK